MVPCPGGNVRQRRLIQQERRVSYRRVLVSFFFFSLRGRNISSKTNGGLERDARTAVCGRARHGRSTAMTTELRLPLPSHLRERHSTETVWWFPPLAGAPSISWAPGAVSRSYGRTLLGKNNNLDTAPYPAWACSSPRPLTLLSIISPLSVVVVPTPAPTCSPHLHTTHQIMGVRRENFKKGKARSSAKQGKPGSPGVL